MTDNEYWEYMFDKALADIRAVLSALKYARACGKLNAPGIDAITELEDAMTSVQLERRLHLDAN